MVVTPEHVEIRLTPAGLGSRFLAATADFILVAAASGLLFRVLSSLPIGAAIALFLTIKFILTWGYHLYFEVRANGRSPGKKLAGLRVVDDRGLPLTLQQSMVRNLFRAVDGIPIFYAVGAVVALVDRHRRRLGDLVAQTVVISETIPSHKASALGVVRSFNSLRSPAVLQTIRNRISLDEREFLLALCIRADGLDPAARYDLMEEVGSHYKKKLGVEDPFLSGENLVRDLTSLLFSEYRGPRGGS